MKIIGAILFAAVALAAVCKGRDDAAKFRYGWIGDMEIDLPDNPGWTSFKFEPPRVEKMSRAGWDGFIETQL